MSFKNILEETSPISRYIYKLLLEEEQNQQLKKKSKREVQKIQAVFIRYFGTKKIEFIRTGYPWEYTLSPYR